MMSDLTLTNAELLTAVGSPDTGLPALAKREIKSIKASYALTKAIRKCDGPMKDFEATRNKLVERFTEKDADGKPVMIDETHVKISDVPAFQQAFDELLNVPVTLVGVRPLTVDELEGSGATPRELLAAGPFVVEST